MSNENLQDTEKHKIFNVRIYAGTRINSLLIYYSGRSCANSCFSIKLIRPKCNKPQKKNAAVRQTIKSKQMFPFNPLAHEPQLASSRQPLFLADSNPSHSLLPMSDRRRLRVCRQIRWWPFHSPFASQGNPFRCSGLRKLSFKLLLQAHIRLQDDVQTGLLGGRRIKNAVGWKTGLASFGPKVFFLKREETSPRFGTIFDERTLSTEQSTTDRGKGVTERGNGLYCRMVYLHIEF